MQEYKHEELVATTMGESIQELAQKIDQASTQVAIGYLPNRGELVVINGLTFVVLSKSDKQGTLHLEILKPNNKKKG